ncbi:hypothetical protein CYMTET_17369 [Cymbomonas tetramitiformis]|uniref:MRPL25 domain-containing protein n=1 Tax=Cymbomonas tetramitiformis TaxID=36881 RepID=A0AAE0L7D8_9CHLO|nr:hypothetical protein CYMTET_17369 [Cymbomonas tetramitiformis]
MAEAAALLAKRLFDKLPPAAQKAGGLPAVLQPRYVEGIWKPPLLPARFVAKLRKGVLMEGLEWPWEKPRAPLKEVKCKGHKREARRDARLAAVKQKMDNLDKIIADFKASKVYKPKTPLDFRLDNLLLSPTQKRLKYTRK